MASPVIEQLYVDVIEVGQSRRALNEGAVTSLMQSIEKIGLRTPITIRSNDDTMAVLVAGAHRLEAVKRLGWEKVDCIVLDCDDVDAELWEIVENLHRADLTKEQRDAQIRRYAELLLARENKVQSRQNVAIETKREDGRGHRQKGVAAKIAEETGLNVRTVQRVLAEPKPAPTPTARSKIDADVKVRAAREVAEIIAEHVPGEWWDGLKANLYAAGAANIAHELTNITGQSIMDKRFA